MTDTPALSPLRSARDAEGLSRETVSRLLDPPVSTKTIERWENGTTPIPRWRRRQLAGVYRVRVSDLIQDAA